MCVCPRYNFEMSFLSPGLVLMAGQYDEKVIVSTGFFIIFNIVFVF